MGIPHYQQIADVEYSGRQPIHLQTPYEQLRDREARAYREIQAGRVLTAVWIAAMVAVVGIPVGLAVPKAVKEVSRVLNPHCDPVACRLALEDE
ncbi:hypothetical protein D2T31_11905 [Sinirhodobacter populi]|uniref:Uncharacterized protein n=1 Tax=Paenirhodobacter populi TaxID=2306993 RepID=A0A443K7P5_9RHOB|nr:hypothetical protein [Sinirhodobacter populi]RWR28811.1 hypothetical protein D2T31_11905 [Sinirhodobacter populi]